MKDFLIWYLLIPGVSFFIIVILGLDYKRANSLSNWLPYLIILLVILIFLLIEKIIKRIKKK